MKEHNLRSNDYVDDLNYAFPWCLLTHCQNLLYQVGVLKFRLNVIF